MKKLLVLAMALAVLALALPAFGQAVDDNDIYGNGTANGNAAGANNTNSQFQNANYGDQSNGTALNQSSVTINNNGAGNINNSDNSGGAVNKSNLTLANSFNDVGSGNQATFDDNSTSTFMNKSTLTVSGVGNNNTIGNQTFNLGLGLAATNSANSNTLYIGDMTTAFQFQYQFTHQYDHQLAFGSAFQDTEASNFFIPINPVHLSQSNTGITAGNGAGSVTGPSSNAFNAGGGSIQGMMGMSLNTGGIAQNQAAANVVTAFSAQ